MGEEGAWEGISVLSEKTLRKTDCVVTLLCVAFWKIVNGCAFLLALVRCKMPVLSDIEVIFNFTEISTFCQGLAKTFAGKKGHFWKKIKEGKAPCWEIGKANKKDWCCCLEKKKVSFPHHNGKGQKRLRSLGVWDLLDEAYIAHSPSLVGFKIHCKKPLHVLWQNVPPGILALEKIIPTFYFCRLVQKFICWLAGKNSNP